MDIFTWRVKPVLYRTRKATRCSILERSETTVDTPSKRKQVTFREGNQEQIPPPPLRKFASTIPDSEDEDGDLSDIDDQSDGEYVAGEETQALLHIMDGPIAGISVGAETQAMLNDIDRACADANENVENQRHRQT